LTAAELAGLDFLIKDMEERGTSMGRWPDIVALVGWLVRQLVQWLRRQVVVLDTPRRIIPVQGDPGLGLMGGISAAEIRMAEELLKSLPEPTLEDLKKVRNLLRERG
jgi:hypothetical protein